MKEREKIVVVELLEPFSQTQKWLLLRDFNLATMVKTWHNVRPESCATIGSNPCEAVGRGGEGACQSRRRNAGVSAPSSTGQKRHRDMYQSALFSSALFSLAPSSSGLGDRTDAVVFGKHLGKVLDNSAVHTTRPVVINCCIQLPAIAVSSSSGCSVLSGREYGLHTGAHQA